MIKNTQLGHLFALFSVLVWGSTFISTKILLESYSPFEILFTRFILGFIAMWIIMPKFLGFKGIKQELLFAFAGLFGVTLYFLLENIALVYTYAYIVSILVVVAPFFTALINHFFLHDEKLTILFFIGFALSISGIALMSLPGNEISFDIRGYIMSLLAALTWSFYCIIVKKISVYGYNTLLVTRRIFAYGILFLIPCLGVFDYHFDWERFSNPVNAFNILFLGLIASALCFVVWNITLKLLGVLKASAYIYAIPVVTVIVAVIVLDEKITILSCIGILFTISGLVLSESHNNLKYFLKKKYRAN